jgi:hypothetical protein
MQYAEEQIPFRIVPKTSEADSEISSYIGKIPEASGTISTSGMRRSDTTR